MKNKLINTIRATTLGALILASLAGANAQSDAHHSQPAKTGAASQAASSIAQPVVGGGTAGQITKWTGFSGSSQVIGDSVITEDKSGRIGIGTAAPTSALTVKGMIETTLGGYGIVKLDQNGEAIVKLPDWFQALNKEFRYSLTAIGGFAPIYVAEKIADNQFKIAGGQPGMEISWQVTGIRNDL